MSEAYKDHLTDQTLHAYLDGELSAKGQSRIERHVQDCTECSRRLEAWRGLFLEIEQLPDLETMADFEPLVLASLRKHEPGRHQATWMLVGQLALAISLIVYGLQRLNASVSLEQVRGSLVFPIQALQIMLDSVVSGLSESFNQFLTWSFFGRDLIVQVPQIASSGTLVLYSGLVAVVLWILGNHYLLRVNGQPEDISPHI